ncbi:MAG: DNA internalization-related competence protein ComEC/Rec2 [Fidelibacterota bacterium]
MAFLIFWYLAGILCNYYIGLAVEVWWLICVVIMVLGLLWRGSDRRIVVTLCLLVSLGGLNHSFKVRRTANHISHYLTGVEQSYKVVVESVERDADRRQKIISKKVVFDETTGMACRGKILIRLKNSDRYYFYGDSLEFQAVLRRPSSRRNPGEFDYRRYLENHHIYALAYLDEEDVHVSAPQDRFLLRRWANQVKYHIRDLIGNSISGEPAAILQALLVGLRGEISDETEQAFIDSGAIHVLAVSGLHVGYISLAIWVITGFLRLPLKPRVIVTVVVLAMYVLVVDIKPSVLRAVIMASLVLISKGWERQINVYNSLAAAAFIQTLIDPLQLFDMGFQLSFMAVFSIVYIYRRFDQLLPETFKKRVYAYAWLRYIFQMFLVSLAALLGTVPITIFYFQRIPIISMVSNLVVIPLVGIIGALGFAQVILGTVWGWFNIAYGEIETLLITVLRKIVAFFSNIPGAYFSVAQISLGILLLLYGFIFAVLNADNVRVRKALVFGLLIFGNVLVWQAVLINPPLTVTFLDVGQGDATLIRLPDRRTMLIDAGDRTYRRDYGELVVVPFLKRAGIRKLDVLMLTHPHSDHIGGAPTVIRNIGVERIWESGIEAGSRIYREIHHLADSLKIPVTDVYSGAMVSIDKNLHLYFLHPSDRFLHLHQRNFNDASLVCKLVHGEVSMLLTGDAERESEEYLIYWADFLRSTIIKVPHHGSRTSSTLSYLEQIKPNYAVISVGENNKFWHPAQITLDNYCRIGAKVFRTDLDHAVQLRSNGKIVKVIDWK